jgi:hypothetical protein
VGSCRPTDGPANENHSLIHFNYTEHPIVLNIKKILKSNTSNTVNVSKLAIGKPGGIDPESDKYDTIVQVYCHICKKVLDHTNPAILPLINSVLLA